MLGQVTQSVVQGLEQGNVCVQRVDIVLGAGLNLAVGTMTVSP